MSWHGETRGNMGGFFHCFLPTPMSLNFHRFVIWYRSCGTQSVGLGQHCLPKGSNGFKQSINNNNRIYKAPVPKDAKC